MTRLNNMGKRSKGRLTWWGARARVCRKGMRLRKAATFASRTLGGLRQGSAWHTLCALPRRSMRSAVQPCAKQESHWGAPEWVTRMDQNRML